MKRVVPVLIIIFISIGVAQANEPLRFGVLPASPARVAITQLASLRTDLEEELGRPVLLLTAPSLEEFNRRTLEGAYDLVYTCNACYFRAREEAGYEVIAMGRPTFHGVLMVPEESPIRTLEDLRGKTVGGYGRHSLAGYIFVREKLLELGIYDEVTFRHFDMAERIANGVMQGSLDAGIFSEDNMPPNRLYDLMQMELREIDRSIEIPNWPWAVHPDVDPSSVAAIERALLRQNPELLEQLRLEEITLVDDSFYTEFREYYYNLRRRAGE